MFPICFNVGMGSELIQAGSTHKTRFAGVDKWLRGEPLPHERAGGPVVHGVDQAADVVVDCAAHSVLLCGGKRGRLTSKLHLGGIPSLLQAQYICHSLAPAGVGGQRIIISEAVVDVAVRTCLPSLEMPIVVPCRSAIELYLEFLPVMTALQPGQCQIG